MVIVLGVEILFSDLGIVVFIVGGDDWIYVLCDWVE